MLNMRSAQKKRGRILQLFHLCILFTTKENAFLPPPAFCSLQNSKQPITLCRITGERGCRRYMSSFKVSFKAYELTKRVESKDNKMTDFNQFNHLRFLKNSAKNVVEKQLVQVDHPNS